MLLAQAISSQNNSTCARPFCFVSGADERSNRTVLASRYSETRSIAIHRFDPYLENRYPFGGHWHFCGIVLETFLRQMETDGEAGRGSARFGIASICQS